MPARPYSHAACRWWVLHTDEAAAWCRFRSQNYTPNLPIPDETRKLLLRDCMHTPSLFCINLLSEYLRLVPSLSTPDERMDRVRSTQSIT